MNENAVEFHGISKTFGGVRALSGVSLNIRRGECHALMGENGAGKSTLGKIVAGIHRASAGTLFINGVEAHLHSPADAAKYGVGMVHQELAFCPLLSVAENLSMGNYPRTFGLFVNRAAMRTRAITLLRRIGIALDVDQPMHQLSTAHEQMAQIAAAVGTGASILIFDEPTSSLSETESQHLFTLIENLKAEGSTIIYVSHRMPEVFRLSDSISILRDGRYVGTLARPLTEHWSEAHKDDVVRMMIGRDLDPTAPIRPKAESGVPLLTVQGLQSPGKFQDISFEVRAGEIVGLAGLVGSGRSEVAVAIFGLDPNSQGTALVAESPVPPHDVRAAMTAGIGLVPEDRKRQGLALMHSGRRNFSLASLARFSSFGFVNRRRETAEAKSLFEALRVKTPSIENPVSTMSGGNQQKVVIAKWLTRAGKILIVDEPTRGVDVGAKAAIHALLRELAGKGMAILVISSELPEVLSLADRILVMREGRLVGELPASKADQEGVLRLMAGVAAA